MFHADAENSEDQTARSKWQKTKTVHSVSVAFLSAVCSVNRANAFRYLKSRYVQLCRRPQAGEVSIALDTLNALTFCASCHRASKQGLKTVSVILL